MPHSTRALDDAVILAGVRRIAEHHHEILLTSVDGPVYPKRRNVADKLGPDLDGARFALRRFHEHQAKALLTVIHLRPIGAGMDMAARHEEFGSDPPGDHP